LLTSQTLNSNNVSVIDTATNTVLGAPISVGTGPIAFGQFIGPPPPVVSVSVPTLTERGMILLMVSLDSVAMYYLRRLQMTK
jgi:YVTN family beta-propeller protein